MSYAPQFTDEQRQQLQASITEALRALQAAFEAIAQAMENAAKGFASVQDDFVLAPPAVDDLKEPTPIERALDILAPHLAAEPLYRKESS